MYTCTHVESVFAKDETNTDSKSIIIENCEILSKYFVVFRFVLFATFFSRHYFICYCPLSCTDTLNTNDKTKGECEEFFFHCLFSLVISSKQWILGTMRMFTMFLLLTICARSKAIKRERKKERESDGLIQRSTVCR